jgi:carbonic anhydrase
MKKHREIKDLKFKKAEGPVNHFSYYVGPNPPTTYNPESRMPSIDSTVFIGPFSSIIGDVQICENVFIGPNVSIRADEGMPFYIGPNTNLQDGVILHGLNNQKVQAGEDTYSIYIGSKVTCAHNSLIHGPCVVGNNAFIGFKTIIFNAIVEDDCYVSSYAVVTGGVRIRSGRFVPLGALIETQEQADLLGPVPESQKEFAEGVQRFNNELPSAYRLTLGSLRYSSETTGTPENLKNLIK